MARLWIIIVREFMSQVRRKGFLISTILVPVFMGGIFVLPLLFADLYEADSSGFAVVDAAGDVAGPLRERLAESQELLSGVDLEGYDNE